MVIKILFYKYFVANNSRILITNILEGFFLFFFPYWWCTHCFKYNKTTNNIPKGRWIEIVTSWQQMHTFFGGVSFTIICTQLGFEFWAIQRMFWSEKNDPNSPDFVKEKSLINFFSIHYRFLYLFSHYRLDFTIQDWYF